MLASCCGSELPSGTRAKRTLVPPMSASNRIRGARLIALGLFVQYAAYQLCKFLGSEAEKLEDFGPWRRFAEAIDAEHRTLEPYVLTPEVAYAGLDCDAWETGRQDAIAVALLLAIEHVRARHRYEPHWYALFLQKLLRVAGQRDFGAGGNQYRARRIARCFGENITTAANAGALLVGAVEKRQVLPGQEQGIRSVAAFDRGDPGDRSLGAIARTPDVHVRNVAQRSRMLYGLMRGSVFP